MTREETFKILKLGYALWPHVEIDDFMVEAAYMALEPVDYSHAQQALKICLRQPGRTFPPTPGELIAEVRHIKSVESMMSAGARRLPEPEQTDEQRKALAQKLRQLHPELFN